MGLVVYDAATAKPVPDFMYPKEYANPRALSDDGAQLLCYRRSHTAIWDLIAGKQQLELPAHESEATAFGPDGKSIVFAGNGLWVVDAATGKALAGPDPARGPPGSPGRFGWAPDGSSVRVMGSRGQTGTVFDAQTGNVVRPLKPDVRASDLYLAGLNSVHQTWEYVRVKPALPFAPPRDADGKPVLGDDIVSGDTRFIAVRFSRPEYFTPNDATDMPVRRKPR